MNQNDSQNQTLTNPEIIENVQGNQVQDNSVQNNPVQNAIEQNTIENKIENQSEQKEVKDDLPKRALKFEDGTIIYDLKITYRNLFDFQRSYSGSKDLMEALVKKQTFDHETMVQLIYVGYLGTNPKEKMEYYEFIDHLDFNAKRDMFLFNDLVGLNASKKN